MVTVERVRRLALALPGTAELDHHGRPSFRVNGRIFATPWDPQHVNVMVAAHRIPHIVRANPDRCTEVWWGKRRAAVRVDLRQARAELVTSLLAEAWDGKRT